MLHSFAIAGAFLLVALACAGAALLLPRYSPALPHHTPQPIEGLRGLTGSPQAHVAGDDV